MFWVFCACTGLSVADCVLLFCAFAVSAVGFVVLVGFVVFVVILMHDASAKQATADALQMIIEYLISEGYTFHRLDDINYQAAVTTIAPESGETATTTTSTDTTNTASTTNPTNTTF